MTRPVRRPVVVLLLAVCVLLRMHSLGHAAPQGELSVVAMEPDAVRIASEVVDQMAGAGELRGRRVIDDPLVQGRRHERWQQFWEGLPVLGATLTRQRDGHAARSVFGVIHPDIRVDPTPTLSMTSAVLIAFGTAQPDAAPEPELAIIRNPNGGDHRLVYRIRRFLDSGAHERLVDAHSGEVVQALNNTKTQTAHLPCPDCAVGSGRGVKGDRKKMSVTVGAGAFTANDALRPSPILTYDMRGDWQRALDVLTGSDQLVPGDLATDVDNDWEDGPNVDAHTGTGWVIDYLFERFGRKGLDGRNSPIVSLVHPVRRADLLDVPLNIKNLFHLNAFFCGLCGPYGTIVYGEGLPVGVVLDGTGQSVNFFSAGLDIVGHELGHAVTELSSQLLYQGESGALSEAFSDLLGVGIEFFMADTGRHPSEEDDYTIGEDVLTPGGIRSLSNPQVLGDPDHYSKRFLGSADNGGVHTNSLIASHAYYLAIEGGTNRTSGRQVEGVGRENRRWVEQAFYRAYVFMLPADATFAVAREATIQSARDLAGDEGSRLEQAIAAAWDAVGVQ